MTASATRKWVVQDVASYVGADGRCACAAVNVHPQPRAPDGAEGLRQGRLNLERLPPLHRVEMFEQRRKQSRSVPPHGTARFKDRLVLIEAPVQIA